MAEFLHYNALMPLLRLQGSEQRREYQEWLKNASGSSLWQSLEWEGYQMALGRETRLYALKTSSDAIKASALVMIDRTRGGLTVWDIPRGPLGEPEAAVELLSEIAKEVRKERAIAIYYSPTEILHSPFSIFNSRSQRAEQPEATVILDLTLSDEELLKQMHEKCRYNIRLSEKRGVEVKESRDIAAFYNLLKDTAQRDDFRVKPRSHYEKFLTDLPGSFLLLAYHAEDMGLRTWDLGKVQSPKSKPRIPIAGLLGIPFGKQSYYYYGASSYEHRSLMAPYLLQWEAIKLCRAQGCKEYDLLGIAVQDIGHRTSDLGNAQGPKSQSPNPRSPWSGLTRFKIQFGGRIETYPPERVIILRPFLFHALAWKRKIFG